MKALTICHSGFEDICKKEIKELINVDADVLGDCSIVFNFDDFEKLFRLCYRSQSLSRLLFYINHMKLPLEELKQKSYNKIFDDFKNLDIKKWIRDNNIKTFAIRCERFEKEKKHKFSSSEVEEVIGEKIIDYFKENKLDIKVNLDNPGMTIFVLVADDSFYFGVDFLEINLSKRDYKVFTSKTDINGSVAYCLVRLAGYDAGKSLLDPFCTSGTIAIEAAHFAKKQSVHYFSKDSFGFTKFKKFKKFNDFNFSLFFEKIDTEIDEKGKFNIFASDQNMRNIAAIKKNSKIANVNKEIQFSRIDIDWLDTKYGEDKIDCIVTNPPMASKRADNVKDIEKLYSDFFYSAKVILKKTGVIVMVQRDLDLLKKILKRTDFEIVDILEFYQGKEKFNAVILKK